MIKKSSDGNTYAIVRENRDYYIMKAETKPVLGEGNFNYIGGLPNKTKNKYKGYEDSVNRLNVIFSESNMVQNFRGDINLRESDYLFEDGFYVDITESSEMINEKKFVLKQPKTKKSKAPVDDDMGFEVGDGEEFDSGGDDEFNFDDSEEEGSDDEFNFDDSEEEGSDDEFNFDDSEEEGSDDEFNFDDSEEDESMEGEDGIKDIQRTTGKLGQQLRDTEDLSSDTQKWVAKSVLSALKLDNMDETDKEDIINTIENSDSGDEDVDIDFMEDRTGDLDLEDDEELLLDDGSIPGYLGFEDSTSYMDDGRNKPCRTADCEEGYNTYHEGMSQWNDDDTNGGMGWVSEDEVSYMDDRFKTGENRYMSMVDAIEKTLKGLKREGNNIVDGKDVYLIDSGNGYYVNYDLITSFIDDYYHVGVRGVKEQIDTTIKRISGKDSLGDIKDYKSGVSYMDDSLGYSRNNDYIRNNNNPAPVRRREKEKEKSPSRPSRNPFTPPSRIKPGEETRPKADRNRRNMRDIDYMNQPSRDPSESPTIAPSKPGTDRPSRPSRNPFTPPSRIKPGEETRPKADRNRKRGLYDLDVNYMNEPSRNPSESPTIAPSKPGTDRPSRP